MAAAKAAAEAEKLAHPERNKSRIDSLHGDLKSLRTLFYEFRKQALDPRDVKSMREEIAKMRGEISGIGELKRQQAAMSQTLSQVPNAQQLKRLQSMVEKQSGEEEAKMLRFQQQLDGVSQGFQQQLEGKFADMSQRIQNNVSKDMTDLKRLVERSVQTLDQVQQKADVATREVKEVRSQVDPIRNKVNTVERQTSQMKQQTEVAEREAKKATTEIRSLKNEAAGSKGLSKENQSKVRELERKTQDLDKVGKVQVRVESVEKDYFDLKKKLYDLGVFKPPLPEEEEATPVGTLQLGEDIFSSRLLLRLGFMKGRSDRMKSNQQVMGDQDNGHGYSAMLKVESKLARGVYDSDSEESLVSDYSIVSWDDNVSGLEAPDVRPGDNGYTAVNFGILAICLATLIVQVLIVALLIYYGLSTGECLDAEDPPGLIHWLILHFSKAAATATAGFLMGKDLMELVNYIMTSVLLESRLGCEMLVFACLRVLVAFGLAIANLVMFLALTNPFDIWINMTALGFVSEMGGAMFEVAKRGFFGHHIAKATTDLNFELFFISEYPEWFKSARNVTVTIGLVFIVGCGIGIFVSPDMYGTKDHCPLDEIGFTAWFDRDNLAWFDPDNSHHEKVSAKANGLHPTEQP